MTQQKEIET